ncbi:hypothetical protein [Ileibacterium valens]|uniref:hypothetical protein n=1 Tax=Ileibacterium valens TaxID=1862668 RepID=UPI0024BA6A6A|nr:hypothetical protein [Ileibacterium valens]
MKETYGKLTGTANLRKGFCGRQALEFLKMGYTLKEIHGDKLIRYESGKIYMSGKNWTTRMPSEDFLDSFSESEFSISQNSEEINDQKDEEYYRWRAMKQ